MTHTIFIDGEAGTTGLEIRERLEARGDLELMLLGDRRRDVEARREVLDRLEGDLPALARELGARGGATATDGPWSGVRPGYSLKISPTTSR